MEYIQASFGDIEQLTEMRVMYIKEDFKVITSEQEYAMRQQLPDYFKQHLGKDLIAFIAKDQGEIVAAVFLLVVQKPANPRFIMGKIGEVLNVVTSRPYRRKGISKKLMEMLIVYAKEKSLDFVELQATKDGYPLYKQLGFKDVESKYTCMKYILG